MTVDTTDVGLNATHTVRAFPSRRVPPVFEQTQFEVSSAEPAGQFSIKMFPSIFSCGLVTTKDEVPSLLPALSCLFSGPGLGGGLLQRCFLNVLMSPRSPGAPDHPTGLTSATPTGQLDETGSIISSSVRQRRCDQCFRVSTKAICEEKNISL